MTRYDKMYVPCHPKEMDAQVIGDRFADFVEIERNKIVLTIEELKEFAVAMVKEWVDETSDGSSIAEETEKDVAIYLQSKGINI